MRRIKQTSEQVKSGPHLYFSPCFMDLAAGVSSCPAHWDGSGDSLEMVSAVCENPASQGAAAPGRGRFWCV